jgi:hypothetical protein
MATPTRIRHRRPASGREDSRGADGDRRPLLDQAGDPTTPAI